MLKHSLFKRNLVLLYRFKILIMKIFTYILLFLALALIVFNITLLDFDHLSEGNSMIALIGIVAAFCAVFILLIFKTSVQLQEKINNK